MTQLEKTHSSKQRTAPRDVRRKQLILAAIDSIAKRGFSNTTLKHVTEGAKLSHGVVNYHFDSKESLYDETLGYLAKEHYDLWRSNMLNADPDPASQLAAIIEADFDKKVCAPKKLAVWFAFWGQAKYRPNYLKIHNRYDEERFDEILKLCTELIEDAGHVKLDPKSVSRSLEALIDGLWLDLMLYPSTSKRDDCRSDCYRVLAQFFPRHFNPEQISSEQTCVS